MVPRRNLHALPIVAAETSLSRAQQEKRKGLCPEVGIACRLLRTRAERPEHDPSAADSPVYCARSTLKGMCKRTGAKSHTGQREGPRLWFSRCPKAFFSFFFFGVWPGLARFGYTLAHTGLHGRNVGKRVNGRWGAGVKPDGTQGWQPREAGPSSSRGCSGALCLGVHTWLRFRRSRGRDANILWTDCGALELARGLGWAKDVTPA